MCTAIHAVDKIHQGKSDSSVMYIPACPLTEENATYLQRQKETFLRGIPGPDFPGGKGESEHVGRTSEAELREIAGAAGLRAFGFEAWDCEEEGLTGGQKEVLRSANRILGFAS